METLESRLQKRMHVSLYALLFLTVLLALSVLLEGCTDTCETEVRYKFFEPQYTTFAEIEAQTGIVDPQPLTTVGKIYIKGDYLFINDPGNGIHIVNNANPSTPQKLSFLRIPGNYDLAIKGNTLYADSYIDLVAFDISSMANVQEVGRVKNVFSYFNHEFGFFADTERGIITEWVEREEVETSKGDCSFQSSRGVAYYKGGVIAETSFDFNRSLANAPGTGSGPGVGGSMAKFTVHDDFLYAINGGHIQPFDVTSEQQPVAGNKEFVAWDIETIFPYGEHLFLGSTTGMHILSISSPGNPEPVSRYEHIRSCDPVVVKDNYAYVTLRSGTECTGFTNQLEVINIEDLTQPNLVKTYPMTNPHGLGIDDNLLFISDGSDGLKIYQAGDVMTIDQHLLKHYKWIHAYDVIPFNKNLIMIGEDGLFQYDYTDPRNIRLLSHLSVK